MFILYIINISQDTNLFLGFGSLVSISLQNQPEEKYNYNLHVYISIHEEKQTNKKHGERFKMI